jgi:peptide deformylase
MTPMNHAASVTFPLNPELLFYPHPILRRRADPVTVFDDALRRFCASMFDCMEEHHGVGLAAPQVGVSQRIFITDHRRRLSDPEGAAEGDDEEGPSDRRVWINPRIENPDGTSIYNEGCLSFPGLYAQVERYNRFDIIAQNEWGVEQRLSLDVNAGDFLGVVVQHELDHLEGRVFVDHLTPDQLITVRKRLKTMEQAYKKANGSPGILLPR